jgi:hypothetical protein
MKPSQRWALFGFILLVFLFLGLVFWQFVFYNILQPVSLVIWLLLRICVLSIGQQYYWVILIFVAMVFLVRLLPRGQMEMQPDEIEIASETLTSINTWRRMYIPGDDLESDDRIIRREFARMLAVLYATRLHTEPDFKLYDALRRGDIPLPAHIHDLAFFEVPPPQKSSLRRSIQSMRNIPHKWIRRWTGQEKAEHYRMIEEMLSYFESSLEMNNDHENSPFHQN